MIASGATSRTASGRISGVGLASAKTIGRSAIARPSRASARRGRRGPGTGRRPRSPRPACAWSLPGHRPPSAGHVLLAALVDQPVDIAEPDVLAPHAELQQHVEAGDPRRAAAGGDDLDVLEPPCPRSPAARWWPPPPRRWRCRAGRRGRRGCSSARGRSFDDEAIGRLDVLEVDRAEGRLQRADDLGQLSGSDSFTSMSKQSMLANFLKRTALPSITGLEASAPILPRPSTAEPLETTATRLPRAV
jgi:hypothetical protein